MKKTLLCAAVAAMTLAACSKNESTEIPGVTNDTKSINFLTSTGITRANNNGLTELKIGGFQVVGVTVPTTGDPSMLFTKPTSNMENNYVWAQSIDKWQWIIPAADKAWPTDQTKWPLQFVSLAAVNSSNSVRTAFHNAYDADHSQGYKNEAWEVVVKDVNSVNEDAIQIDASDPSKQEDYLFAKTDVMKTIPTGGAAKLTFKHIMSNVSFNAVLPEGYKAIISDVIIKNIGGSASESRSFIPFNTNPALTGTWKDEGPDMIKRTVDFIYCAGTAINITGQADAAPVAIAAKTTTAEQNVTMKLMPQAKTAGWDKTSFTALYDAWVAAGSNSSDYATMVTNQMEGAFIELTYALVDDKGTSVIGKVKGTKDLTGTEITGETRLVRVAFPLDFTATPWQMGMKYAYNIRLGMPDSTNGTVTDPEYKDETGTDVPGEDIDNPATKPGEDISKKGDIGFIVDVDTWADYSGNTDIK